MITISKLADELFPAKLATSNERYFVDDEGVGAPWRRDGEVKLEKNEGKFEMEKKEGYAVI